MRRLTVVLLSLLTGTAGHYLNRRWDRAAFFLGMIFLVIALAFARTYGPFAVGGEFGGAQYFESLQQQASYMLVALVVVLLISAWLTWRDGRLMVRLSVPWRGVVPVLGAILTSLLSLVMLMYAVTVGSMVLAMPGGVLHSAIADTDGQQWSGAGVIGVNAPIVDMIYFGGSSQFKAGYDPLPEGDAYLVGRLDYQAEPVANASLKIMINNQYVAEDIKTDAQGQYSLRLPSGEWFINSIEVQSWSGPNKAELSAQDDMTSRRYLLVSALNEVADIDQRLQQDWFKTGLPVSATPTAELLPALSLHVRDYLQLHWPDEQAELTEAKVSDAVIHWSAVPDATQYEVKISEVIRESNSASYHPVTTLTLVGVTELPLNSLQIVPDDTTSREYSVEIKALTEDGAFLTINQRPFGSGTFTLTDGNRLANRQAQALLKSGSSAEDVRSILKNNDRLDAVVILIREDMLDAADSLLLKIDRASPGRKTAVTGFLRAKQNRCEEARALLNQAKDEGGQSCVPTEYWAGCR